MITNTREVYDALASIPDDWPLEYKEKITLQHVQEWYPENDGNMRDMFRLCATERLFIPKLLYMEEAIIYVDTDVIFMRPPEDIWKQFYYFDSTQFASIGSYQRNYLRYQRKHNVSIERTPRLES